MAEDDPLRKQMFTENSGIGPALPGPSLYACLVLQSQLWRQIFRNQGHLVVMLTYTTAHDRFHGHLPCTEHFIVPSNGLICHLGNNILHKQIIKAFHDKTDESLGSIFIKWEQWLNNFPWYGGDTAGTEQFTHLMVHAAREAQASNVKTSSMQPVLPVWAFSWDLINVSVVRNEGFQQRSIKSHIVDMTGFHCP